MTDISKMPFGKHPVNFGKANMNIVALSDTHGQIDKCAAIQDTYEKNNIHCCVGCVDSVDVTKCCSECNNTCRQSISTECLHG